MRKKRIMSIENQLKNKEKIKQKEKEKNIEREKKEIIREKEREIKKEKDAQKELILKEEREKQKAKAKRIREKLRAEKKAEEEKNIIVVEKNPLKDKNQTYNRDAETKRNLLSALEKSLGIVSTACKMVGIRREHHYYLYKHDLEYKQAVDEIQNVALDFVETKLFENIDNNSDTSIIFYLKTRGKLRGYIEKQEIEHSGGIGVNINFNWVEPKEETIIVNNNDKNDND